ncbi:mannose-6-phosphate isomerase pmi40 [Brettanomyces nanus]|uniref:Mannose-6-phosphate isomerase n=1 Tax=Eeniella nana TaxID=13502 RepID=A0A875S079_EENNA|nr:mannose-6-phosphate isomerase pmi40 [Brettanomyces nanus]QPG74313.1 mannose-6-phosphate isomerase pmi40 [Brettanomyces nanus]
MSSLFPILGAAQNYAWGKIGSQSAVARYAHDNDPSLSIDESEPFAELWMGTHPKAPAVISNDKSKKLSDVISSDPEKYLGQSVISRFGSKTELPFLFKVLSINKVLSIQAHPDKSLGAQLHAKDPDHYPDSNHKPEMAVAITDFEAFCGFQPLDQIDALLQKIPEFHQLVGADLAQKYHVGISKSSLSKNDKKKLLQAVFGQIMKTPEDVVAKYAANMVARTNQQPEVFGSVLADLIQRLNQQFPGDVGLFCGCLMLNHCFLKSGEAMFLQAREPHAYISGDIMECMAASDNVIRAGFTPKFKDVETLVSSLTYSTDPVEDQKQKPVAFSRGSGDAQFALYDPPIDEFSVLQVKFDSKKGNVATMKGVDGPSIIIVTEGSGEIAAKDEKAQKAETGHIFFLAPRTEVVMSSKSTDAPFTLYRAFCEL